jgi:hypothetical protein
MDLVSNQHFKSFFFCLVFKAPRASSEAHQVAQQSDK